MGYETRELILHRKSRETHITASVSGFLALVLWLTVGGIQPSSAESVPPNYQVLHTFTGHSGAEPGAGVVIDATGTLYGTTIYGGNTACPEGCGMVFKLAPPNAGQTTWTETVLHAFSGGADGAYPRAGLIMDPSGSLYGTAYTGGNGCCDCCGVVFKLTPPTHDGGAWTETVLHAFKALSDGGSPRAALIMDASGALYGTAAVSSPGLGVVFKLTPPPPGKTEWTETVLHTFDGGPRAGNRGETPMTGLVMDRKGGLYGTTAFGGQYDGCNCGLIFKLTPPPKGETIWTETVLHAFNGKTDGGGQSSDLVIDDVGDLYGSAFAADGVCGGGTTGCGVIFKLTPPTRGATTWTETVLDTFAGGFPGPILRTLSGSLYGAVDQFGPKGYGLLYELTPPAPGQKAWRDTILYAFQGGAKGSSPVAVARNSAGVLFGTGSNGGNLADCMNFGCGVVFDYVPNPHPPLYLKQ